MSNLNVNNKNTKVIASRCKSKKALVLNLIDLGLAIVFIVLFIVNIITSENFTKGDLQKTKVFSYILLGCGCLLFLYTIYGFIYLYNHNKRLGTCLEYDNSKKVFIATTAFDKKVEFSIDDYINIKTDFLSDGKMVVDYRKSNGKKDRISLGWIENSNNTLVLIKEIINNR